MSAQTEESDAYESALEQIQGGNFEEALRLVEQAAEVALEEGGINSSIYAQAQFDRAKILVALNQLEDAAEALKLSYAVEDTNDEETRNRLNYNTNLGKIYEQLGQLEEAEEILREGLVDRAAFYGDDHPGYAFALEPLADVLRLRGYDEEALGVMNDAVRILWQTKEPRVASAIAHRACFAKAMQKEAFSEIESFPDEIFYQIIEEVLQRTELDPPEIFLSVLSELQQCVSQRCGSHSDWLLPIVSAIAELSFELNDLVNRLTALRWLVEIWHGKNDPFNSANYLLQLANTEVEAGQFENAEKSFLKCEELLPKIVEPTSQTMILRSAGLFWTDRNRLDKAAEMLESAVKAAENSKDHFLKGKAYFTLGIFQQHQGQNEKAKENLKIALSLLEEYPVDHIFAEQHLSALENEEHCGCGSFKNAIQSIRDLILDRSPPGIVEQLDFYEVEGEGSHFEVVLAREATVDEQDLIESMIASATSHLHRRK